MDSRPHISIEPGLYILVPILILLIPLRYLFAWTIAVTAHELGHICALYAMDQPITQIKIGFRGAEIHTHSLSSGKEVICAAAGPLLGGILILFAKFMPLISLCAAFQTAFNLLPLPQQDGERILQAGLSLFIPKYAGVITVIVRYIFTVILSLFCILYGTGIPGISVIGGLILLKVVKRPCKRSKQIVQ